MKQKLKIVQWLIKQTPPVLPQLIFMILINSVTAFIGVMTALVVKSLIDAATIRGHILKWLGILACILLCQIVLRFISSLLSTYCYTQFANELRTKLYTHITYSKWEEQIGYHSANIITRFTSDLNAVTTLITASIPAVIALLISLTTAFITLLYLTSIMAIAAIVLSPLTILFASFFSKRVKKFYMDIQDNNIKHRTFLQETLQNIIITKAFCVEKENINTLKAIQNRSFELSMAQTKFSTWTTTFFNLGGIIGYFLIFAWGALNLFNQVGTYGTLTALMQLFSNVQGPFNSLAHYYPQFVTSFAAAERLMVLEELHLEDNTPTTLIGAPRITLKAVSFAYDETKNILDNISCTFEPGEIIGLIGPSGEGKTTLIRLLLSLIAPTNGEIFIEDNEQPQKLLPSFRNYISYVPQGNTLFSGTITSNLYKGNPNATLEDIQKVLHLADIDYFVDTLENQLETVIGEKGLGLSEGQAQRIAIARAFLRQKPILILDEATSALDPDTEVRVLESIIKLDYHPTCIIITHRLSALAICDKVYMLEKGNLTEQKNEKKYCINT